jgi:nicotinamidase-related amidase
MKEALLVIDYTISNVFPKEYKKQSFKTDKIQNLYRYIQKLIDYCRQNGKEVIWIVPLITALKNYPDNLEEFLRAASGVNEKLDKIYKLIPRRDEKIFGKISYSAFSGTNGKLDSYLKAKGINTLLISGIYSTTCVDATIVEAFGREYFLKIFIDCVETVETEFSQEFQKKLFVNWKSKYGDILTLNNI